MFFGGVEGGATHSNLVICDEMGRVVGKAKGLGTNHWTLGIDECANRIIEMVNAAKDDACIPRDRALDCLGLMLSGCEQESSNAELAARVKEKDSECAKEIYVASDTMGSLFTGVTNGGMVLIAGTGSNALLRTPDGQQYGCGGWGYILGDEGGAYWIAHKAVKTVFDDVDGLVSASHCTRRVWEVISEHFAADTRADLLPHTYKNFDKPHFAGVTFKLSALAYKGDPLARRLFYSAGAALASHAAALVQRTTSKQLRVVCVGSVWKSWDWLKPGFLKELADRHVNTELELVRLRVSSALGAAWLAAKHINYNLPRDDSAFCNVFYTYRPGDLSNGNGDLSNGHGDLSNGNGDLSNGHGDLSNSNGECTNGNGDAPNGNGDVHNGDTTNGKAVNGIHNGIPNGNGIHSEDYS